MRRESSLGATRFSSLLFADDVVFIKSRTSACTRAVCCWVWTGRDENQHRQVRRNGSQPEKGGTPHEYKSCSLLELGWAALSLRKELRVRVAAPSHQSGWLGHQFRFPRKVFQAWERLGPRSRDYVRKRRDKTSFGHVWMDNHMEVWNKRIRFCQDDGFFLIVKGKLAAFNNCLLLDKTLWEAFGTLLAC